VRRRRLRWVWAALALAFVIVLSVPDHDRVVALYVFVLLVGAVALGGLVVLLAGVPVVADGHLVLAPPPGEHRPEELVALERELREALESGAVDARLRARTRSIASARLARVHGVDMARQPQAAAALLSNTVVGRLLADAPGSSRVLRLAPEQLRLVVDELEAL
jgi:hypothetical protein